MDLKEINLKRIFLISGGLLIIFTIILLFFTKKALWLGEEKEPAVLENRSEEKSPSLPPVSEEEQMKNSILILASSFTERFGSYSNQGDFENIKDLYSFMTPNLRGWSESYIEKIKAEHPDISVYYGLTTKTISRELLIFDDKAGYAKVKVSTQRRESIGSMENEKIFYQDMEIEFEKINDAWKVDGVWLEII